MNWLEAKVAVIMGGTSGIGLATADGLPEEGARVVVGRRRPLLWIAGRRR